MHKHKSIKALLKKLTEYSIYNAEQLISTEHHLEREILSKLKQHSTKQDLYLEILTISKELNILATASVLQDTHTKLATSIKIESLQRQLKSLANQL